MNSRISGYTAKQRQQQHNNNNNNNNNNLEVTYFSAQIDAVMPTDNGVI